MNSVLVVRGSDDARNCGGSEPFTIVVGQRGAPGKSGADGAPGGQTVTRTAGVEVSALRAVYESQGEVFPIDPSSDTSLQMLGISTTTGSALASITVQTLGFIEDAGWNWSEGLVFASSNGVLTQTPPDTGWELVVGFASSPTRLNLEFNEPVLLA